MESDVCKHCTHAGCLDACPTGALFRTEFGTVVVQEDVCNGCGYCVPACPFGVIDRRDLPRSADDAPLSLPMLGRKEDGRVWKCTLCYDRLKGGHEPACAKACPTNSIQFGELDELRERAQARLATLEEQGWNGPRLYGEDPDDGVGGFGAFFLLLDEPEVYGLPPDPVGADQAPAAAVADDRARRGGDGRRSGGDVPRWARVTESQSYYGRPILKEPTWTPEVPVYLFTGGIAGGCAVLHGFARLTRNDDLARATLRVGAAMEIVVADPPDLRPRAARAVPEHAAGVQGHLADERRQLGPRRLGRHRRRAAALEAIGVLRPLKWLAELGWFATGPPLATYTGALLANTAIPVWSEARGELPYVFGSSACASAGAAAAIFTTPASAGPARRAAVARLRARARRRARDGEAARLRRRGLPAGRGRQVREALEGPRRRGSRAARARRPPQPHRSRRRRLARARGRAGAALVDLQSGLPVRARPEVHRRAAEGAQGAARGSGRAAERS